MCTSVAEGGRRCTGQHLSLDQHANRAERRRAADRERKAVKSTVTVTLPEFPTCEYPRPSDIPDGYLHQSQLRAAGIDKNAILDYRRAHRDWGMNSQEQRDAQFQGSVWWVSPEALTSALADPSWGEAPEPTEADLADALLIPRGGKYREFVTRPTLHQRGWTDELIDSHLGSPDRMRGVPQWARVRMSQGEQLPAVSGLMTGEGQTPTEKRAEQHKADDEVARTAGHPFGKDAEIRRLATPAARDKAADGTPIFVHHEGGWKVLMPYDDACSRHEGERFPVLKANGMESFQRVRGVTKVGAHNGVLMGLADVDTSPGPQEQAEINAKRAAEAAQREAAKEAAARQRQAEKEQRQVERDEARKSLRGTATGDDLAWVGAANIKGVADGSRPPAIWSKTDNDGWVVVAREDQIEDAGNGRHKVDVHKRGQGFTEPFSGYVIGHTEVGGVTVAVLSKRDPNAPREVGCYSCGGPGPLDEYGYCGC